jgi:RNA polymerase sigma factor (sigma-70 family)
MVEMQELSDAQLLCDYAERGTETAFGEIVARHADLVFSAALRQVNSPDLAADLAQTVFTDLARKSRLLASRLSPDASLVGWLYRSTRFAALRHLRDEIRHASHERQAMEQLLTDSEATPDWEHIRPILDEAMAGLNDDDRDALLLRYFKNHDFRAVGLALGVSDDTAQKRVSRALDKLRDHLSRRGITTPAAALSIVLSANTVQAAPVGLAVTISTAATVASTSANTSTALAVTKNIAMTTLQKALIAAALATAVGTGVYEARRASRLQEQTQALQLQNDSLARQVQEDRDAASNKPAVAQRNGGPPQGDLSELLKLRAQVAKLRDDARELAQLKAAAASSDHDPMASEMKSWLDRVKKLKERLAQMPDQKIPELQFLSDQDWLGAVKYIKQLETDADFDQAFSDLRSSARNNFAAMVQSALRRYAQANRGQPPSDLSQLQPYFAPSVDDSVLQRYQLAETGVVTETPTPLSDHDDLYYQISAESIHSTRGSVAEDIMQSALQAFAAANNGQKPADPSQLLPYVTTPAQQAVLQKLIQNPAAR